MRAMLTAASVAMLAGPALASGTGLDSVVSEDGTTVMDNVSSFGVIEEKDPNDRLPHFNNSKMQSGVSAKLENCSQLIVIPVGVANGNESYGAYCESKVAGKSHGVMVCDDNFGIHFALKTTTFQENPPASLYSKRILAYFTFTNCFGG